MPPGEESCEDPPPGFEQSRPTAFLQFVDGTYSHMIGASGCWSTTGRPFAVNGQAEPLPPVAVLGEWPPKGVGIQQYGSLQDRCNKLPNTVTFIRSADLPRIRMFSGKEREYLDLIVRSQSQSRPVEDTLAVRFPNPTYRRKLLWVIRRKASRGFADWALYAEAAEIDPRILPREPDRRDRSPPLFADSLITALRKLRRQVARLHPSDGGAQEDGLESKRGGD